MASTLNVPLFSKFTLVKLLSSATSVKVTKASFTSTPLRLSLLMLVTSPATPPMVFKTITDEKSSSTASIGAASTVTLTFRSTQLLGFRFSHKV